MSILKNLRGRTAPLNVRDLAELLDVTEGTIQRWVRRHQEPAIRVGDVIRFDPGMLADWIELQATASQRYQDGINRLIRMRDRALEDKSFQITRDDVEKELFNAERGPASAPADPTVATGMKHSEKARRKNCANGSRWANFKSSPNLVFI
jgi:excisionase family DNA binding protein